MKDDEERRLDIAAFRYRLIAAALETSGEGVSAALRAAAALVHEAPGGGERRAALSTLWSWLARYRRGGLLALRPAPRKDRGLVRAIPADILQEAAGRRRQAHRLPGPPARRLRAESAHRAERASAGACRRLGEGLHLRVYLDALDNYLVRSRAKKGEKKP